MSGNGITVHVEWLARNLMRQQEEAAVSEQRRMISSYRLSRVPSHVRDHYPGFYTPKFVAIGPLHASDGSLRPARKLKMAYLHNLISRGHPDTSEHSAVIQRYVRLVAAREHDARAFYTEEINLSAESFIEMMVLDGCFIIEHLVNHAIEWKDPSLQATPFGPVQLSVDLILAENQIPFFILVELINATDLPEFRTNGYTPPVLLVKLVLYYLAGEKGRDLSEALPPAGEIFHVLHLLHKMLTTARTKWEAPASTQVGTLMETAHEVLRLLRRLPLLLLVPLLYPILPEERRWRASYGQEDVPCASDLKRMWVRFRKPRGASSKAAAAASNGIASVMGPLPLAVKLAHEDKLWLPQLCFEFRTKPLLLNLMAFEQSVAELADDVSAYVSFMAKMVQSAEDAGVLIAAEVVHTNSESKDQLVSSFRQLGMASDVELEKSYLGKMLEKLRERSKHPLFMMWADVQRNYFTVPWAVVAEFVALITFISGILQTYASFKQKS